MGFWILDLRFAIERPAPRARVRECAGARVLHSLTRLLAYWLTRRRRSGSGAQAAGSPAYSLTRSPAHPLTVESKIPNPKSKIAAAAAFTLVEMMTAVGLTVIMLTIIAAIFTQASTVMSVSEAQAEIWQNARVIHDFLVRDLSGACLNANFQAFNAVNGAVVLADQKAGTDVVAFLSGTTNQGDISDPNDDDWGVCLVVYYLRNDNTLRRGEYPNDGDSGKLRDLSTFNPANVIYYDIGFNVRDFQLGYWDPLGDSPSYVPGWKQSWITGTGGTDKKYLPTAVEVTLKISDEQNRLGNWEARRSSDWTWLPVSQFQPPIADETERARVMTFQHVIRLPESPK